MPTPIRYVTSGGFELAYQVTGRGLVDLVLVPGFVSHLELDWEYPGAARLFERLGSFARLIRFDPRGVGLSVRTQPAADLESRVEDAVAVMDAAGSSKAAILGYAEGGHLAIRLAAEHPERVSALALFGGSARTVRAGDYPWAESWEERIARVGRLESGWGASDDLGTIAPGADGELQRWYAARARAATSPGTARALLLTSGQVDVRPELAAIDAPTLVLHRVGDRVVSVEEGRYLAEQIRGAKLVELEGDAHLPFVDPDPIANEVEAFLTGMRPPRVDLAVGEPGSSLAGYRIEELAGRGGMGSVYIAHDDRLGRRVALKVIAPELAGDERFRDRFLREWRIAAGIEHPNVVPVHDAGEEGGRLYLAMRYVEGTDLKSLLAEEGKLEPERALAIAAQVASALDAAHERGLVHRDVKPGNVLLDTHEHAYLCDFGLTKELSAARGVTKTGQLVGTLEYIAPEQVRAERVDGRADQYALACVLYECLAGRPPFQRETEAQMLWAHLQEPPPPIADLPAVDPVLAKGLAKEPAGRYASCGELVLRAREALGLAPAQIVARKRLRLGRRLVLVGAILLAVAVAAAVYEIVHSAGGLTSIAPNSVGVINARNNRLVAQIPVGGHPTKVVVGQDAAWVLNGDDRTVSRVDARTKAVRTFSTGSDVSDIAVGAGALWVAHGLSGTVSKVDLESTLVERTTRLPIGRLGPPTEANFVAVGRNSVWVSGGAERNKALVWRLNPAARVTLSRIIPDGALALALGAGSVWIRGDNGLVRVDARTGAFEREFELPVNAYVIEDNGSVAVGNGDVWVTSVATGAVWRIRASTNQALGSLSVNGTPQGVAVGHGSLWVADAANGRVLRYDQTQEPARLVATIHVGGHPSGVAYGAGKVWVTVD